MRILRDRHGKNIPWDHRLDILGNTVRLQEWRVQVRRERLNSAAPDLLYALENALDYFERIDDPRYIAALAAIAKARGTEK
mgnify:CR=1 FL=1